MKRSHVSRQLHLQGLPPLLSKRPQSVPLVTDLLTPIVDVHGVVIVQLTGGSENEDELSLMLRGKWTQAQNKQILKKRSDRKMAECFRVLLFVTTANMVISL